ncbi:amino acid transporter [uncultured Corynebacterium sp.]|uniref:amino acid transporter n=1 Tax=uncultured Corynebacterium sp. TaxID=159447 RepID=UPI0025EFF6D4|nr:amino acid transporter [uncultured Corynebacterium sp.]
MQNAQGPAPVRLDAFTAQPPTPLHTPARDARHPWWQVMCLSGVDYFSTLGYQPGIAVAAAGALAPVATVVLVLVTLCGAVPVYRRIARESPDGLGSVGMLARMVTGWKGKLLVLVLLGFAACDFMVTVTLSSSDAATHLLSSSHSPLLIPVTLALAGLLAVVFLKGFAGAVRVSVVLVASYLFLTTMVVARGLWRIVTEEGHVAHWTAALAEQHSSPWAMIAVAVIVFPKLALGMSGFETGVSVMPLIRPTDPGHPRESRIRSGRRLVATSAMVMSVFLVASSLCVTMLVPADALAAGGAANGRALAWLAHEEFGDPVGNIYDAATIAILWFAGASAMAGLLALIPKYLPVYGMAPEWARRSRPMVAVLTVIAVVVVLLFRADVDAQSGAYATGVLVLLTSGAVAVAVSARRAGQQRRHLLFLAVTAVLLYTLVANVVERPEGVRVAAWFILGILVVSAISRTRRSLELRGNEIRYDRAAENILRAAVGGTGELRLAPHTGQGTEEEYGLADRRIRRVNRLVDDRPLVFLEITVRDPSDFASPLEVTGRAVDGVPVLQVSATAVPNAIAALALDIRDFTGAVPDIYFSWESASPVREMLRFLVVGRGENAAVTREILRRVEPERGACPRVHVG